MALLTVNGGIVKEVQGEGRFGCPVQFKEPPGGAVRKYQVRPHFPLPKPRFFVELTSEEGREIVNLRKGKGSCRR